MKKVKGNWQKVIKNVRSALAKQDKEIIEQSKSIKHVEEDIGSAGLIEQSQGLIEKMEKKISNSKLLSVKEAAEYTGLSANALNLMRHYNRGPKYIKYGDYKLAPIKYNKKHLDVWMQTTRNPEYLTSKEVAKILNLTVAHLHEMRIGRIKENPGPKYIRLSKSGVRYLKSDVEAYLKKREEKQERLGKKVNEKWLNEKDWYVGIGSSNDLPKMSRVSDIKEKLDAIIDAPTRRFPHTLAEQQAYEEYMLKAFPSGIDGDLNWFKDPNHPYHHTQEAMRKEAERLAIQQASALVTVIGKALDPDAVKWHNPHDDIATKLDAVMAKLDVIESELSRLKKPKKAKKGKKNGN